jgi:hypothetical protein
VLRETVIAASRCLDDLSSAQRRVLVLRAGIGPGAPRSRGGVARRLHISERRVARLERTGLRRLRMLAKRGACAPPARTAVTGDVAPDTAAAATVASMAGMKPAAGAGDAPRERDARGRDDGDGSGGLDVIDDTVPSIGDVAGESVTNHPEDGISFAIPLILIVLAVLAVLLTRARRREVTPEPAAGPVEPAAGPVEPAAGPVEPAAGPVEPPARPARTPWHRSTMNGPSWNDPRPSGDRPGEWSSTPSRKPEQHEEWTAPPRRIPSRHV